MKKRIAIIAFYIIATFIFTILGTNAISAASTLITICGVIELGAAIYFLIKALYTIFNLIDNE